MERRINKETLLDKAFKAPEDISFEELIALLLQNGWELKQQKGIHTLFYNSRVGKMLPIQKTSKAKAYQVKQVLKYLEKYHG